ncbi:hypothetical protein KI387_029482, partial [Taxus chinensis]
MSQILSFSLAGFSEVAGSISFRDIKHKNCNFFPSYVCCVPARRRFGRCQQNSRIHEVLGKDGNGAIDVAEGLNLNLNFKNAVADRVLTEPVERKIRAGPLEDSRVLTEQVERKPRGGPNEDGRVLTEPVERKSLPRSGLHEESYLEKQARDLLRAGAGSHEEEGSFEMEAWKLLRAAVVNYCGSPIGTIAANDPLDPNKLNYDQVFIRDFIPSGIAFLLKGEYEIVRNFILHTLQLQRSNNNDKDVDTALIQFLENSLVESQ